MPTPDTIPFILRLPMDQQVEMGSVSSTTYRVHGLAHLDRDGLRLEWTGTVEYEEVGGLSVTTDREALPVERLAIPLEHLGQSVLRGRWWRPRLEIGVRDLDILAAMPGSADGRLRLHLRRRDWHAAQDFVVALELARADHALRAAESPDLLPP